MKSFVAVMIIPTGIGCTIGGHAGDATAAARLLAGVCDTLIVHPNVVNASDLNEMPSNALYVEGSMLDRFLRGEIYLQRVLSNRILVVCNHLTPPTINCASAARSLLGADVRVIKLEKSLRMVSIVKDGRAWGTADGMEELSDQVSGEDFDALAIHTSVTVADEVALRYMRDSTLVNPWGGVEALVSQRVSTTISKPVAHAPIETMPEFNEVVYPSLAPELISGSNLFSVLKGLHKAPRIANEPGRSNLSVEDVDVLISPICWGPPHDACLRADIPIIMVKVNQTNREETVLAGSLVNNYIEAAGAIVAIQQGIDLRSLDRPMQPTKGG